MLANSERHFGSGAAVFRRRPRPRSRGAGIASEQRLCPTSSLALERSRTLDAREGGRPPAVRCARCQAEPNNAMTLRRAIAIRTSVAAENTKKRVGTKFVVH